MIRKVPLYEKPVIVGGFCLKLWVKTASTKNLTSSQNMNQMNQDELTF